MKTFETNFSVDGIQKISQNVDKVIRAVTIGTEKAINYLTEYGVRYAQDIVEQSVGKTGYYTSTGTLKNSIVNEQAIQTVVGEIVGRIYTNLDYAQFVEFGTGVVGQEHSHPKAGEQGWNYNTMQTPKAHKGDGWYYKGADGKRHFTRGQVAVQYMWKTEQEIKRIGKDKVLEYISRELEGI